MTGRIEGERAPTAPEPNRRARLGQHGEDVATLFVQRAGMVVLERNWRCRQGELDIIALDEQSDCLVVIEVKTRSSEYFGSAAEAVTPVKLRRLRQLAGCWLADHPIGTTRVRIDVIGILIRPGSAPVVQHLQDVQP